MDVNETIEGISVAVFQSTQPEDSTHDGVTSRGIGFQHLAIPLATLDDSPRRKTVTDFGNDLGLTQRRAIAARLIPKSKLGRGDLEFFGQLTSAVKTEFLIFHTDNDFRRSFRR
jgi:hypothetical protein